MVEPWDGTQEHPYQHINEGIAAATPGDTVFVFSGTYTENVVITKNLTLTGESKDTTFIDGGGNGHVLHIYGSDTNSITVHVSGFSIRNAGDTFACIAGSYMINNEITNNKINSINGYGIQLYNCQGVTISDNLISGNIFMGVNVYLSIQNIITNNIIQNNQEGIYLYYDSNYNEITDNAIRDNSESGVRVVQSSNNVFSRNNFVRNCPNAQDPSVNTWSKDGQGNYWDDYSGYDNNSDGIGDIPYNIPGGNNKDYYPLGYFKQPEPPGGGNQPPIAFIPLASVTTAFFGDPITFNGDGTDSDGTIVGYYWRSNLDGFLSTQQSFTTTTLSIGTHTIYFKVQDNAGAWSQEQSTSVTIDSRVNHPPTASIDAITPNPVKQGQPVLFRGHGTDDDGTLIAYSWLSSKDGVIGTISSCIVRNLTIGTHTIYFKVKDNMNEWSSPATMTLIIEQNSSMDPSNHAPSANIGGPYQGVINQTIVFNASRSSDSDGTVQSYVWSFGDTSSGTGPSPMHTYTIPGTYRVTVQVTDNDGVSSTASTSVIITQSASQGNNPNGVIDFILSIPFPVIIVIMALSILGIIGMFIHWMKKR
jgi:parallel beta-helix repeat protein